MNDWETLYQQESDTIIEERKSYSDSNSSPFPQVLSGYKIFEYLSVLFLIFGFIALILMLFTDITLVQTTCLFLIYHILHPTDGDRCESQMKGIAQDLANIRIASNITSKHIKNDKT